MESTRPAVYSTTTAVGGASGFAGRSVSWRSLLALVDTESRESVRSAVVA
jgi:hypothetical protein